MKAYGVSTVPVIDLDFFKQNILYYIAVPGIFAEKECHKGECGQPSQPFILHSEWFPAPGSRNSRRIALARGDEFFGIVTSACSADISVDVYIPVAPDMGPNVVNVHAVPFIFKAKEIADGLVRVLPVSVTSAGNGMEYLMRTWMGTFYKEGEDEEAEIY